MTAKRSSIDDGGRREEEEDALVLELRLVVVTGEVVD